MADVLIRICRGVAGHPDTMMMAGGAAACIFHCLGTCALCLSGGTALGASLFKSCEFVVARLAPALLIFTTTLHFLSRSISL